MSFEGKNVTIIDDSTILDSIGYMWKRIPLFNGKYWISEFGDVLNEKTFFILKDKIDSSGYRAIYLYGDGKDHTFKIHRLVAFAFLPNPNNFPIVLHLDNNKLNCHYSNLKWGTYSENRQQAIDDGLARNPDVRIYFNVVNEETGDSHLCFGIQEVAELLEYDKAYKNLYQVIFRGTPMRRGKFKGYKIIALHLTPAWTYMGPIGYNIGK